MNQINRDSVSGETLRRRLCLRLRAGAEQIRSDARKRHIITGYLLAAAFIWLVSLGNVTGPLAFTVQGIYQSTLPVLLISGLLALLIWLGTPRGAVAVHNGLLRAGLVNHAGEAPYLLRRYTAPDNPALTILEFDVNGIPRSEWEEKQADVEAALTLYIAQYRNGSDNSRLLIYTVPADGGLPNCLPWEDDYLSDKNFELVAGFGLAGPVTINLAEISHILIGGATGSGKSVLLRCLLYQAIMKGAAVCIADFKGGVDYSAAVWNEHSYLVTDEEKLLELLANIVDTLKIRKQILINAKCQNIDEYNEKKGHIQRIIFACDEVAELLDKTGLNKEGKERVDQITSYLSTIARLGRAFGIHLILATQRPDANVIPGQIKNNVVARVCGAADNVLSQIILDSTDAADLIPKETHGRFLLHDGTIFQGFLFREE